jgi:hypothetical protein
LGQGLAQRPFWAGLGTTLTVHYLVNGNGPFEKMPNQCSKQLIQLTAKYHVVTISFIQPSISNHGWQNGTSNSNPVTLALIRSCVKIVPSAAVSNHRVGMCDLI